MRNKTQLAIGIIGFLVLLLIFLNFILPKISLPNFQKNNEDQATDNRPAPVIKAVELNDDGFSPESLTVKVGEVITFTNKTESPATVNSNPHPVHNLYREINLGEFGPEQTVQVMFEKPGTYSYHNHFAPTQQGTIVVEE